MKQSPLIWMMILSILAIVGCDDEDTRLVELSEKNRAEQAAQNRASTELTRDATDNQRRVMETVEKSRQDLIALQKDLESQRTSIDQERQNLAQQRYRESLLAPILASIGLALVTALPLILSWYLLQTLKSAPPDEAAVAQLLITDLVAHQPVLRIPSAHTVAPRIECSTSEGPSPTETPPS